MITMTVLVPSEKTMRWLLEDQNPPVRNLTKKFLLDKQPTASELMQVDKYSPIKTILQLMKSNGSWNDSNNPYKKYTGTYWQIIFLCDLNANSENPKVQNAIEYVFSHQLPEGTFPHALKVRFGIFCLTANLLRSCIYFGLEKDERVQKGVEFISQSIIQNKGVICNPLYLLPDCQMALTKVLAMYAIMSENSRSSSSQEAIELIINKIIENRIYHYVPAGAKDYYTAIKGKKTTEINEIKSRMTKNPEHLNKTEIKRSWTKFGFPNSYTSDALETLYWLALIDPSIRPEYKDALDLILQRMNPSGFWINENMFRNPMLAEIEPKKSPSKWVTFRALYVLRIFAKLDIQF